MFELNFELRILIDAYMSNILGFTRGKPTKQELAYFLIRRNSIIVGQIIICIKWGKL
jgi:hypothetical protein